MICVHADAGQYSRSKENEFKYDVVLKDDSRSMNG